ncbi:MAG: XRE family transcriptional regulator [Alphaproteobacteria bacterium]|nr:XRE family transcriptional regulator [Alphaproteobacteria bacterium]
MISGKHIRAARAWKNWSQSDLVERSGISLSALVDFEQDRVENPRIKTLNKLIKVFDDNDMRIHENGIEEVERNLVIVDNFMDVLFDADMILKKGDTIYFHCADDRRSSDEVTEKLRELDARGVDLRFTYERGNTFFTTKPENYRWIDAEYFSQSQVEVVYADRYVIHLTEDKNNQFQIVRNKENASVRRKQIEYWWNKGENPWHGSEK